MFSIRESSSWGAVGPAENQFAWDEFWTVGREFSTLSFIRGDALEFIEVEILNWSKHQPRKDIKHPSWFAMSNRILEDSKLFGLSGDEWHALLYIFCQASQQNSGNVKINLAHADRICSIKKKTMLSALSRLCDAGVTSAYAIRTDAYRDTTLQDTTNTTEQYTATHASAFALFWSGYPNKKGKSEAEKKYRHAIKLGAKPEDILSARDRYREQLAKEGTEAKFILHGSTFMGRWRDFLDPDYGKSESFAPAENKPFTSITDLLDGGAA